MSPPSSRKTTTSPCGHAKSPNERAIEAWTARRADVDVATRERLEEIAALAYLLDLKVMAGAPTTTDELQRLARSLDGANGTD